MRKNFKLAALAIASVLVVTACGANAKTEKVETSATESKEETQKTDENKTEETKESLSEAKIDDLSGVIEGNVYTNKAFNIKFDADANGMVLASPEELAALGQDAPEGHLEVYAYDSTYTKTVMIGIMNEEFKDVQAYMQTVVDGQKKINEEMGMEDSKVETATVKLLGEDVPCVKTEITSAGVTQYQIQAFIKSGDRIAIVVLMTMDEEIAKTGMDMFTKAE